MCCRLMFLSISLSNCTLIFPLIKAEECPGCGALAECVEQAQVEELQPGTIEY